ncbi:PREDICTED: uncharacterized protein LOC104803660 [Tarenaya hassleriana]|uniref:uncharacterized protein LOC104803660 n=1 Tax=Tarenaya hassleriana TaxID=28532 RepID=UPI00053C6BF4|nr:PREDICTED: uncharacterized protein LOC104803660 [Tarenaya hassleriana]
MILRSASSPALKPRAAAQNPLAPRVSVLPAGVKMIPRASSERNLKKAGGITKSASSRVLEGSGFGGGRKSSIGGDGGRGGEESMERYYEEMIRRFPGDSLLLANYARFFKEVKGDEVKAEKYCERAILTSKNERDGGLLSMYGDLIWKNHGDSVRAESYFDQAVQSSPSDCYVLASYARFLWDADEEDDEGEGEVNKYQTNLSNPYSEIVAS